MKRNLDGSYNYPVLVAEEPPSIRARSILTTVAVLGAVGAPLNGGFAPPAPDDKCPKCKRGELHGSSTRYCHRCGFFVTADIARAQRELGKLAKVLR